MKFLFVGERPSTKAMSMHVRWEDGRLAAKQLFDALKGCGLNPSDHYYANWFQTRTDSYRRHPCILKKIKYAKRRGVRVVALGRMVSREMDKVGLTHIRLVHPAARGKIRKKGRYILHVKRTLFTI